VKAVKNQKLPAGVLGVLVESEKQRNVISKFYTILILRRTGYLGFDKLRTIALLQNISVKLQAKPKPKKVSARCSNQLQACCFYHAFFCMFRHKINL